MRLKLSLIVVSLVVVTTGLAGCKSSPKSPATPGPTPAVVSKNAGPLPPEGYKAEISLVDPPEKLRAGQVEVVNVKVRNASNVTWWQRGGEQNDRSDNTFYIAAGNRWLDKDGKLTSETEGHNGIPKDLKPGEETEMPLQITAPKTPGDWILNLDMVQEGVAWFGDKGSPTTRVKLTVLK